LNYKKKLREKKVWIPLAVLGALIGIRIILPYILLPRVNAYLKEFSPTYEFHVADLDLSVIRGAYRFEGIEGKLKRDGRKFTRANSVEVSMAWRELIKGRLLFDIDIDSIDFTYLKELTQVAKKEDRKDAKDAKEKLFPARIERVDLRDSSITLEEFEGLEDGKRLKASSIQGRISNLTPEEKFPTSFYNLRATLLGESVFKVAGHLNMIRKPLAWDVDSEVQDFNIALLNDYLKRNLPLTFTKGKLDLYVEAKSEDGKVEGYIKPFIKDLDVVANNEHFKGAKHWLIEMGTALGNLILRTSDTKTVATKVPFSFDKTFHADTGEALSKAIQNGFEQKLSPGIEDKYDIQ
jgi:Domain of Unknown Function (DUF748)